MRFVTVSRDRDVWVRAIESTNIICHKYGLDNASALDKLLSLITHGQVEVAVEAVVQEADLGTLDPDDLWREALRYPQQADEVYIEFPAMKDGLLVLPSRYFSASEWTIAPEQTRLSEGQMVARRQAIYKQKKPGRVRPQSGLKAIIKPRPLTPHEKKVQAYLAAKRAEIDAPLEAAFLRRTVFGLHVRAEQIGTLRGLAAATFHSDRSDDEVGSAAGENHPVVKQNTATGPRLARKKRYQDAFNLVLDNMMIGDTRLFFPIKLAKAQIADFLQEKTSYQPDTKAARRAALRDAEKLIDLYKSHIKKV
ncbi:hypothetical protein LQ954_12260 [Sphingomonas sp. IC-11]|uniref:hypothetical protein n=1 Tax=Sphingomonas sp. IC-11 TaxID=2898528 RepID=UPI001E54BC70|nr:hypothetical protein [Sphingomonas sp. IC-11]MCD2316924.1 hypothetical protein [Sphingomonas sp. IC-11]